MQYLVAPADSEGSGCSDCGYYLGKYWEPWLIVILAVLGLLLFLVGAVVGGLIGARYRSHRTAAP